MEELNIKLCDIQGRLFELSGKKGYDSEDFIKIFMNSTLAKSLDSKYNRMQWVGEEYLLEELLEISHSGIAQSQTPLNKDMLYWIGYLYRFWHFYTGEDSKKIYKQAPVETMKANYLMFHTMDTKMAVDDLKEIYKQKQTK